MTQLAESYPRSVCESLALAFLIDSGKLIRKRLDINKCARFSGARIGEAQNPGPPRPIAPRDGADLRNVVLLEPGTIAIRSKILRDFRIWLDEQVGPESFEWVVRSPLWFVKLLVLFGHASFQRGTSLHYFRQLLAHVQKEWPETRAHIFLGWELVTKWECLEPVQHRPPMPEALLRAMISVGLAWRWRRWTASLIFCFFAVCRIGEILKARRADLLTPRDLLADHTAIYLNIRSPKSRRRGAKVQYATFLNDEFSPLILSIWEDLDPGEPLFPLSSSSFRNRWEKVLSRIGVGKIHRLTPGSLRAGGAVALHRAGVDIHQLLWSISKRFLPAPFYQHWVKVSEATLPYLETQCRL